MAKFNKKANVSDVKDDPTATVNYEGGLAFTPSAKMELYLRSAACLFGEPKFYDKTGEGDQRILDLVGIVGEEDPEFPLKLASYCRNELYLRSLPVAILVKACDNEKTKAFVRKYVPEIVKRADELTETVALYTVFNGDIGNKKATGMLCNPLKRGLADVFHTFDEYQFAKYDRDGVVKLKDVIKIVHPKPDTPEQSELFKRIKERNLAVPETWETVISTKGSTKENWEAILPKMPFMARLRNLRNFLQKGVDVQPVIDMLRDPEAVAKSKQLPFRFFSAHKELKVAMGYHPRYSIEASVDPTKQANQVLAAIEDALELSVKNIPTMPGTTFITCDVSGSMDHPLSSHSSVSYRDVCTLLGAMASKFCDDAVVSVFGTYHKLVHVSKQDTILTTHEKINRVGNTVGHGTQAYLTLQYLREHKIKVDRILLFSDMQCYDYDARYGSQYEDALARELRLYKSSVNPDVVLYSIDMAGYGTLQFPEKESNVIMLGGWSDKILTYINAYEQKGMMLERIATYNGPVKTRKRPIHGEDASDEA